jgi:predicted HicB family RNase H-like nuclease
MATELAFEKREIVSMRIKPSLHEQVRAAAVANNTSVSRTIENALSEYLSKKPRYEHP